MGKKLFITDFDGTLLKDDKTISQKDIKTLRALKQKKIYTAIATGRSVYSFETALQDMGITNRELPIDYIIFSTGAGIMEFPGGGVICEKNVSFSDVKKIIRYFDHGKFDYMVHKSIPQTHYFLYRTHGNYNPDFQARLAIYEEYASPLIKGQRHYETSTEVLCIIPGKADMDLIETIKKDLSGFSVIQATSPLDHQSAWIEVFHKNVSKARTGSWLAGKLGVAQQNIVSVGNDYNDQDLLAWSGQGFVVENGPESLKQVFNIVSSNNLNGVSHAAKKAGWID